MLYVKPARSYENGKGTDMLSVYVKKTLVSTKIPISSGLILPQLCPSRIHTADILVCTGKKEMKVDWLGKSFPKAIVDLIHPLVGWGRL